LIGLRSFLSDRFKRSLKTLRRRGGAGQLDDGERPGATSCPFTDRAGSIAVFTTREAAKEFVAGDPFASHGVISAWQVREWRAVTP
jgi:uncharacterized protein YciI